MFDMSIASSVRLPNLDRLYRQLAIALTGLALVLAWAPAVLAGQPVAQTLNPEPPDFYTCAATGDGTICRAHTVDPYESEPTGIYCGVAAVEILDSGIRDVRATRWYDGGGNLTRRLRTFLFRDAHLTNPATGRTLPYSQHNADNDDLAVPGDLGSSTLSSSGHLSITAPGFGPVVLDIGHSVVSPEGDLLARSGVSLLDVDAICAALGAPNG
jgi:hypothetical protein